MPTREESLAELGGVFDMIAAEYVQEGLPQQGGQHRNRACLD
jgi:hypothetical protein